MLAMVSTTTHKSQNAPLLKAKEVAKFLATKNRQKCLFLHFEIIFLKIEMPFLLFSSHTSFFPSFLGHE